MITPRVLPPLERVRELVDYCPETGAFTHKQGKRKGKNAACKNGGKHSVLILDGQRHYAHRVAWFLLTGKPPTLVIDHINGDGLDNRACNIREVTQRVNLQNMRKGRGVTGLIGAAKYFDRFQVRIRIADKRIHLGHFDTAEEAHRVYVEAKRRLHAGCTI